jgi:hypothetical protein
MSDWCEAELASAIAIAVNTTRRLIPSGGTVCWPVARFKSAWLIRLLRSHNGVIIEMRVANDALE